MGLFNLSPLEQLAQLGIGLGQLADKVDKLTDSLLEEEQEDKRTKRPKRERMLTLDACIQKAYADKKRYPQIAAFIVKLKPPTKGGADGLEIMLGYMDKNRKAITLDGKTALAYTYEVTTIDEKLVDLLDGNDSAICEF